MKLARSQTPNAVGMAPRSASLACALEIVKSNNLLDTLPIFKVVRRQFCARERAAPGNAVVHFLNETCSIVNICFTDDPDKWQRQKIVLSSVFAKRLHSWGSCNSTGTRGFGEGSHHEHQLCMLCPCVFDDH
jgi:hypothetical protein